MSYFNFHLIIFYFCSEKLAVTSSDGIAALNENLLRFLSASYTSCLFHIGSCDDTIATLFVSIQYIFPVERLFLSILSSDSLITFESFIFTLVHYIGYFYSHDKQYKFYFKNKPGTKNLFDVLSDSGRYLD